MNKHKIRPYIDVSHLYNIGSLIDVQIRNRYTLLRELTRPKRTIRRDGIIGIFYNTI